MKSGKCIFMTCVRHKPFPGHGLKELRGLTVMTDVACRIDHSNFTVFQKNNIRNVCTATIYTLNLLVGMMQHR